MSIRSDLLTELAKGTTIITPNNRLSHQLMRDFVRTTADKVYDKPLCLPYALFLRGCFKQVQHDFAHIPHPVLLNAAQERLLWQSVINDGGRYACTDGLLTQVQDAWNRCQLWGIDIQTDAFLQTPQTQQFQAWHNVFLQGLLERNAITGSQLVPYMLPYLKSTPSSLMIWLSFDDFTPQQRLLQATFESLGTQQCSQDLEHNTQRTSVYAAQDTQDELNQLVIWLKSQLETEASRIAVIVPDLQQQSQALQRHLRRHIPIETFELSLGKSLSDYPLVSHALHWLGLNQHTLSNHQIRLLLHSPYLGGSMSEFSERSRYLEEGKFLQEAAVPSIDLIHGLRTRAPKLSQLLLSLSAYPTEATADEWVCHFKKRLAAIGFPGEYPLNSSAYQYLQRLQTLFDDFLLLGLVQPIMTSQQALQAFSDIAKTTIFQVHKNPCRIQVLGLLEASGCEFDSVWVTGLTDQCLPQKVKLSPFIPMSIQREHLMPHALPERELNLARQLLSRLQDGSHMCVFSYPRLTGDTPNLPSPLIDGLPLFEGNLASLPPHIPQLIKYIENFAYPLTAHEALSGGTAILANQAKCPFRAFAAHRLHAKAGLKQSTGLNDAERGQVVHQILEHIWKSLGSQRQLLSQTSMALEALIGEAIEMALSPLSQYRTCSFPPVIQSIERNRLRTLIAASLDWEKKRAPFVVKAIEQAYSLNLAGLDFKVRVDRLDAISDDETWVIDYKTSLPTIKPWNEERPEAPQLLLYALLDSSINGLLFLKLQAGQIACSGISETPQDIVGLSTLKKDETWAEKQNEWERRLTMLATEFREGHCPPTPQRDSTCSTCEYKNICRI